jgi:hypothetical protein
VKYVWAAAFWLGTFAVLEIICQLLHLSNGVTTLIVLSPTIIGGTLLGHRMLDRRADSESPKPRE